MENKETEQNNLPVVSAEVAKATIRLALVKAQMNIQSVIDKEAIIVYNEDNLASIKEFSEALDTIKKKIDAAHKEGKRPYLEGGDAWDAAKNDLLAQISPIISRVTQKHTALCQAVEKRRKDQAAADKKKKETTELISTTILDFSGQITACKTSKELTAIESRVNLEKTRKNLYGDLLPTLIEQCNGLNELVKSQKEAVKEFEKIDAAKKQAEETGNDEALEAILGLEETLTEKISHNRIKVEERAVNATTIPSVNLGYTEVLPTVKAKRTTVTYEITDIELLAKKHPEFVSLVPNEDKIKEYLKTRKAEITDENPEIILLGIKFLQKKTF